MNIPSVSTMTYVDLQNTLDKTIGKIGLASTIRLLQKVTDPQEEHSGNEEKVRLITSYLVLRCIAIFDLQEDRFYSSTIREYREARMACYSLLRKYTDGSYQHIAEQFGQKKRNILYHCRKCADILSVPQFHREFVSKYQMLENHTLEFIAKLNAKTTHENTTQV